MLSLFLSFRTAVLLVYAVLTVRADSSSPLYWFSFGDSYTTTLYDINGTQPSPELPLGNPTLGKGTWTGGKNYIGWLSTSLNRTPVQTYNFGWPAGTISNSVIPSDDPTTHSFEQQVHDFFEPRYAQDPFWTSDNSIWSVFFGINDIGHRPAGADRNVTVTKLLDKYFGLCDTLYSHGARRFLFIGVPPLDRAPAIVGSGDANAADYSGWVNAFNGVLAGRINDFARDREGVSAATFDSHRWMQEVLDNPSTLGFQDNSCVDSSGGNRCVWWDPYHAGSIFHLQMAIRMLPALNHIGFDGTAPSGGNKFFS